MNVEQMVDLVNFAKSNVEKFEKRLMDTRADIETIKSEKRKEEESLKAQYESFVDFIIFFRQA